MYEIISLIAIGVAGYAAYRVIKIIIHKFNKDK